MGFFYSPFDLFWYWDPYYYQVRASGRRGPSAAAEKRADSRAAAVTGCCRPPTAVSPPHLSAPACGWRRTLTTR